MTVRKARIVRYSTVIALYASVVAALVTASGCASVPTDAVVAQELVVKNIEVARKNQLALIDSYTEDQREYAKFRYEKVGLDKVVRDRLGARASMPPDEVMQVALEYSTDLRSEYDTIDAKARSLRAMTNEDFDQLVGLAKMNVDLLSAMNRQAKAVSGLLGSRQKELDAITSKFSDALKAR
jgi:hypothetical protein